MALFAEKTSLHLRVLKFQKICLNYTNKILLGLENTYDCWCGNTYPTKRIPDKNCNLLCIFANALTCGSTMAASVYRTGISQSGRKTMLSEFA